MYRVATFAFVFASAVAWNGPTFGQVDVVFRGKLQTGIAAIGGETTGTIISTKDITFELDLGKKPILHRAADQLNGKQVVVEGQLRRKRGVEIAERWIVEVARLAADENNADENEHQGVISVSTHKPTTIVKITEAAVVDIRCSTAGGKATLKRTSDQWPTELAIRMRTSRLEMFKAESESIRIETSYGDQARPVRVTDRKTTKKITTDQDWLRIGRVGDLKDGYILIELRQPFLEKNPASFEISWVDVYRN